MSPSAGQRYVDACDPVPSRIGSLLKRFSARLQGISKGLACATLVLAPLPYGSVDTAWIMVWCALLSVSLLVARLSPLNTSAQWLLAASALSVLSWGLVLVLQSGLDPFPENADAIWARTGIILQRSLPLRIAATAQNPLIGLGPSLVFSLALFRFLFIGAEPAMARLTVRLFAVSALVVGTLSFIAYMVDPTELLGRQKLFYVGNFTGTFVNRNTAATFFGTATILWFSSLMERMRLTPWRRHSANRLEVVLAALDQVTSPIVFTGLAVMLCLGWTAMTASRAGFILTLACMILVGVISALRSERLRERGGMLVLFFIAIIMPVALLLLFGGLVSSRIASGGLVDTYRLEVYRICLIMIGDHPWLGIGLGNFEAVFPAYRSAAMGMFGVWERAHSTPLEIAVEMGLPLFTLIAATWLAVGVVLARNCFRRGDREVSMGVFGVYLLGTLHSTVDFSLQIPGYAIVFASLVAVGIASNRQYREVDRQHSGEKRDNVFKLATPSRDTPLAMRYRFHPKRS